MRYGFTTGSCAAAAAKAAAYMLLTGKRKTEIVIKTPKGIPYNAKIVDIVRSEAEVSCAVEKDGGDDPDITTGALIYAKVSYGVFTADEILVLWRALCLSSVLASKMDSLELFSPGSLNGIPTSESAILISSFFGRE